MKFAFQIILLSFLFSFTSCTNKTPDTNDNQVEEGPKATGPTEKEEITLEIENDEPEDLNTESLSGEWVMKNYNLENYIHIGGMNENQKGNFKKIVENLIGLMKFNFQESGNFESYTGLPTHVEGKWFIDENGANLTMQQTKEITGESEKPISRVNIYTIDKFSKNFLTLTDTDGLTFIFQKSKK